MPIEPLIFRSLNDPHTQSSVAQAKSYRPRALDGSDDITLLPAAPAITEEDVNAAEERGYKAGFTAGEKEGRQIAEGEQYRIDKALNEALSALTPPLEAMIEQYNRHIAMQKAAIAPLALKIARKVAGQALHGNAAAQVESLAASCAEALLGEANIVITVHPGIAASLEARLRMRFANRDEPGEISIVSDEALAPADFRIQWKNGAVERDTQGLWEEIERHIEGMAQIASHEAQIFTLPGTDTGAMPPPPPAEGTSEF